MKFILAIIACSAASYLVGRSVSDRANAGRVRRARENAEGWEAMYRERVEMRDDERFKSGRSDLRVFFLQADRPAERPMLSAEDDFDFNSIDSLNITEH